MGFEDGSVELVESGELEEGRGSVDGEGKDCSMSGRLRFPILEVWEGKDGDSVKESQ